MGPSSPAAVAPTPSKPDDSPQDMWAEALKALPLEDRQAFKGMEGDMLGVLKGVKTATENKKKEARDRGWTIYKKKNGDVVKIRDVLEKISDYLNQIIELVDFGVSFDASGHAAMPWAVVKFVLTAGMNDISLFTSVAEGVESISGLITRYSVIEKLYLGDANRSMAQNELYKAIITLYTAMLVYLSKAKHYFSGSFLERFGRSLVEAMRGQFNHLLTDVSETQVEKWTGLVAVEFSQNAARAASETQLKLMATLKGLEMPLMQIQSQVTQIQDRFNREDRIQVFKWLSPVEYRSHHDNASRNLLPGSGKWLFDSTEFIQWAQSNKSCMLWLHGIPGSGKTALAATTINHFDENPTLYASRIAFFYCSRSTAEPERGNSAEVMGALVRQLASSKPDQPIKKPVADRYEERKIEADDDCSRIKRLTVEDSTRVILELCTEEPCIIVVDALDECEEDSRQELLEALSEIVAKSVETVRVIIFSRDEVDIHLQLRDCPQIEITAAKNGSDIANFVEAEVTRLVDKKRLLDGRVPPKLKKKIVKTFTEQAQGMFRWVTMSLETLQHIKHVEDFKAALGKLPPTLTELYDVVHKQIDETGTWERSLAALTLKWLLCARRLLSTAELIAAAAVGPRAGIQSAEDSDEDDSGDDDEDKEKKAGSEAGDEESEDDAAAVTSDTVLRSCRNLVVVERGPDGVNVFGFAHPSVREYLTKKRQDYSIILQNTPVLERCLDVYISRAWPATVKPNLRRQTEELASYAQFYWPMHYRQLDADLPDELKEKVLRFMVHDKETSPAYENWAVDVTSSWDERGDSEYSLNLRLGLDWDDRYAARFLNAASYPPVPLKDEYPPTPVKAAAAFGFQSLMTKLEVAFGDKFPNRPDALEVAAREGHAEIVKGLLAKKVDPNGVVAIKWWTPLHGAAQGTNEAIVKILIEAGADPNSLQDNSYYRTPLVWAVITGNERVVKTLIDCGAKPDLPDNEGKTPLSHAAKEDHESIVQLLLAHGADPNSKDCLSKTPLMFAVEWNHEKIVEILFDKGARLDVRDVYGRTPLTAAFQNESIALLLLSRGAGRGSMDSIDGTVLSSAVQAGSKGVVQWLLAKNVDVNGADENHRTALWWVSNEDILSLLLERQDIDIECADTQGWTPLIAAADHGHERVVQVLVEKGANLNAEDKDGLTALDHAWNNGHKEIEKLLEAHLGLSEEDDDGGEEEDNVEGDDKEGAHEEGDKDVEQDGEERPDGKNGGASEGTPQTQGTGLEGEKGVKKG